MTQFFRRSAIALAAVGALAVSHVTPAHAWVRGGVFFGVAPVPFFVGPPAYYPYYYPPAYYPPPVTYSPAPGSVSGRACYTGSYVCPLDQSVAPGTACSCPTNGGGRIGGRAG